MYDLVPSIPKERQTDLRELGFNERQIEALSPQVTPQVAPQDSVQVSAQVSAQVGNPYGSKANLPGLNDFIGKISAICRQLMNSFHY